MCRSDYHHNGLVATHTHELTQSHCGDNREGTFFYIYILRASCLLEIWARYVSWITYDFLYRYIYIHMLSWKQCALPVITTMALWQLMHLGTWSTVCCMSCMMYELLDVWVATKPLRWWPGGHIVFMIAYVLHPFWFCEN